jgi:hypothetical protein
VPSPLAHGLAGLIVHVSLSRDRAEARDPWRFGTTIAAALVPDVDLLFRWIDGVNHHNNELHSIGFALAAGLAGALAFRLAGMRRSGSLGLALGLAWATHTLLDWLNRDTHPPIGLQALWPFSAAYYKVPWPIFLDIGRTLTWETVRHDLLAAAWETAVLAPLLWWTWRRRSAAWGGAV